MEQKQIFPKGTLTLGVNYWASHAATRMWSEWDASVVKKDMHHLAEMGCKVLRVFPLWSDFQPVMVLRANCYPGGFPRGYAFVGERPLPHTEAGRAGVDETMMERFETLCDLAWAQGMRLIVPLLNGHMTFRIYNPPAVDGYDHFRDPESLMWQGKFIHYFVKRMKHHPAILAWEIGNESNCMGEAKTRSEAWTWTAFVTDAIRAEDNSRPVGSGMHSLSLHDTHQAKHAWTVADQAELCDALTAHPYPMWRDYVNCDAPNTIRWGLLAPTENKMYGDIAGKESFIEEIGTLRRTFSTFEALGDQLRTNLWHLWDNDGRALLWWCAFDQIGREFPPYDWDEAGMEHGVMTEDYRLNPTGKAIRDFAAFLETCPVKSLPPQTEQAVCVLGRDQSLYELTHSVGVLAKQAGLPFRFVFCDEELPDAKVYLIPCAGRKAGLNRAAYRKLAERIEEGATVYFSFASNVCIPEMSEFFGFEMESREKNSQAVSVQLEGKGSVTVTPQHRFRIKSHGAKAIDREGYLWEYVRGKGRVVVATLPLELLLLQKPNSYQTEPAYELYRYVGAPLLDACVIRSTDGTVTVSEHKESEGKTYAIVCNNSPEVRSMAPELRAGWHVTVCDSDRDDVQWNGTDITLGGNAGALLVLEKE